MPGYDEALDVEDCPWGDPNGPPDLDKARDLIKQAGAEGAEVTVWGNNEENTAAVTEAYADMLNEIGLNATPKVVDGGVYFQTIGNQQTEAQTGFANWFQDFPHPLNFLFLIDGDSIQATNNQNFGNVSIPEVNRELDELRSETDLQSVTDRYAEIDNTLAEDAAIAPYGHRKLATFFSDRMDFENCRLVHPLYQNDYSSWCLKD
jgi:peptide/nickel transport system substrate-binding protein